MTRKSTTLIILAAAALLFATATALLRARAHVNEAALLPEKAMAAQPVVARASGCLPTGDGFFRARLDGELQMQLDWVDAQLTCEGMARPGGNGIRLSFRRERPIDGPLLIVLGIAGLSESSSGKALPTNVTIIEERTRRVFGTLGDDKCTVDEIRQELLAPWRAEARVYRVTGRGFCTEPALIVGGERTVLMSTFDFSGQVSYETIGAPARTPGSA